MVYQYIHSLQRYTLTQLPERKETAQGFHHVPDGDFKTVTEFNGCDRRNLRMDQQHCSYSTILTSLTSENNINTPKHLSCLQQGTKEILQKMWQSNSLFVLNTKCYVWDKSNTLPSTTPYF